MSALNSAPNSAPSSSQAAAVVQPHLLKDFKVLGLMGKVGGVRIDIIHYA